MTEENTAPERPKIKYKSRGVKKGLLDRDGNPKPKRRKPVRKVERKRPMPVTEVGAKVQTEPVPKKAKKKYKSRVNKGADSLPEFPLSNTRWELFCQNMAIGMTQADAYRGAGFSKDGAGSNASTLMAKSWISARIAYIQEQLVENRHAVIMHQSKDLTDDMPNKDIMLELGITKAYLLAHLQNNVVLAQQEGQISASNKAIAMLWSVLNEGNPGDPDATTGPNANKAVSLNVLLNFAEKLDQKTKVTIVPDDDIHLVRDEDLKDVSDDVPST